MHRRLPPAAAIAALLAGLAALAWLLGWLKTVYYFRTFGADPGLLELSPLELARESWFVLQNAAFFVLLWWVALRSRWWPAVAVAVAHALLPIAAHYAFAWPESGAALALIRYRHTLLKLLPFAVLAAVWLRRPERRRALTSWHPPPGHAAVALFALIAVSWSISAAKHFGSYDANRAMRRPDAELTRVRLVQDGRERRDLWLLHADPHTLLLWDPPRTLAIPRSTVGWIEGTREIRVQPGGQYL